MAGIINSGRRFGSVVRRQMLVKSDIPNSPRACLLIDLSRERKAEDLLYPRFDGFAKFFQSALKEMIRAVDHHQLLRVCNRSNHCLKLGPWTKLIARAADEQLRLHAIVQEVEGVNARCFGIGGDRVHRCSHPDQGSNVRIGIRRPQPDGRAEGKSGEDQR